MLPSRRNIPDTRLRPNPTARHQTPNERGRPLADEHNLLSYAVQVTTAKKTILSAYRTADILGEYRDGDPRNVTGDTYFRIASNTKVFTVLAVILTEGMSPGDGILKYIPELADGEGGVEWGDIWRGLLGSVGFSLSPSSAIVGGRGRWLSH